MQRIVVFHCNAFNIYYTDSDIYTSTIKWNALLCSIVTPSTFIILTATYMYVKNKNGKHCCVPL